MHIVLYLVSNKINLNHQEEVSEEIVKEFAIQHRIKYKIVSAKTGFHWWNVDGKVKKS